LSVKHADPVGSTQRKTPQQQQQQQQQRPKHQPKIHPDAAAYDEHVASFAKAFARPAIYEMLRTIPPRALGTVLDHGSGTGQVAREIHALRANLHVHCLDPSEAFLSAAPRPKIDRWASVQQGTAADLATDLAPQKMFLGAVSNLVLPFIADPVADLKKMAATIQPGGRLALTTLGNAEDVEAFFAYWDTLATLDQRCWKPERYVHFRYAEPPVLAKLLTQAGYTNVRVKTFSTRRFIKPDAAWEWLSTQLPVGIGKTYAKPSAELLLAAQEMFIERANGLACWRAKGVLACADAPTR
jgi:2-polyprenyl-3-methyl-5-hydroxy-6-metoxy-1,4-benzoquinol methylase